MGKCKKKNVFCGTELASDCVDYTGDELKSLEKNIDQCDMSMTDVAQNIDKELKAVKDSLDTKKLSKLCISSIDKEDSVIIIINKLISEICDQSKRIKDLEENGVSSDILDTIVDIDSNCLTGSHCANDGTLRSLLIKIVTELCLQKTKSNNSSNTYVP